MPVAAAWWSQPGKAKRCEGRSGTAWRYFTEASHHSATHKRGLLIRITRLRRPPAIGAERLRPALSLRPEHRNLLRLPIDPFQAKRCPRVPGGEDKQPREKKRKPGNDRQHDAENSNANANPPDDGSPQGSRSLQVHDPVGRVHTPLDSGCPETFISTPRWEPRNFPPSRTHKALNQCGDVDGMLRQHPARRSWSTSHGEDHAELCIAAHHPRVSLCRLFKGIGFNHGTHATQFGETQCVLRIGCCSRGPALNRSTSTDEL